MSAPGTLIEDLMLLVDKHVTSRRARTTRMVLLQGRKKPVEQQEQDSVRTTAIENEEASNK